jgi:tectonin-like protein
MSVRVYSHRASSLDHSFKPKIAWGILPFLLVCVMAQASYNWTPSVGLADNTAWCASNNCLTSIGGIVAEIKAGVDGTIYGLTAGHVLYTWTRASGWVESPSALQTAGGYPLMHISVGSASEVLALNTSTGSDVYLLNPAGTAWQLLGGGLSMAEIGADGSIWGINLENSTIYTWTGSAWMAPGGLLGNIAVGSSGNVWGVNPYNQIFLYVGGTTVWQQISVPFTPSSAENAIAAAGNTAIAVLDTSGGIHVSSDGGQTWFTIKGTASSITGGGPFTFVLGSTGVSYHLNLLVPTITNTGGGFWACPPAEGCPQGSYHTQTATVYFGGVGGAHGTAGVTTKVSGYPENVLAPAATEMGTFCDPFTADPQQVAACEAYYEGNSSCSVMGPLNALAASVIHFQWEFATTEAVWTPSLGPPTCGGLFGFQCQWPVVNHCTAATTPPDLNLNGQRVNAGPPYGNDTYYAWLVEAGCVRLPASGPWYCSYGFASLLSINVPTVPYPCTYNP